MVIRQFTKWGRAATKAITVLVLIAVNLMPLAAVFAQEASDTPLISTTPTIDLGSTTVAPTDQGSSTPPPDSSLLPSPIDQLVRPADSTTNSTPSADITTNTPQAPLTPSGSPNTPTVTNPSLFTYQSQSPKVDKATGALTEKIIIDIPPGRNGLQPDLALQYNSQNLADSIVGYGWSISIPYIQRLNKTGTDRLYTDNYFTSSVSGELATSTSTSTPNVYYARVDDGSFVKYVFSNNTWTATDKNGTRYEYGTTSQAQQFDAATSTAVYKWMLEEVRDTNNNYVKYTYSKDSNQIYPYQITYTGNGTTDGVMSVVFATSTRPDSDTEEKEAFKVTTKYRISEVDAKVNGVLVRKYALSYSPGNNNVRSLLSSVQETGQDTNGNQLTLPATTFQYASSTVNWQFVSGFGYHADQAYIPADMNGDGINEQVIFQGGTGTVNGTSTISVPLNWAASNLPSEEGTRLVDINADGYPDLVMGTHDTYTGSYLQQTYINTSSSTPGSNSWSQVASSSADGLAPIFQLKNGSPTQIYTAGMIGNFNGDDKPDALSGVNGLWGNESYVGDATSSGWSLTSNFPRVNPFPGVAGNGYTNSQLVDINGDGLDDWVHSTDTNTTVCLNTGKDWSDCNSIWDFASSTYYKSGPPGAYTYWDRGVRFIDVNGDGLPDLVRAYHVYNTVGPPCGSLCTNAELATVNAVYVNTGSGWATSTIQMPQYIVQNSGSGDPSGSSEYADWNGDGLTDFQNYKNTTGTRQDVLTQINYPKGGNDQVSYIQSPQTGTNPNLPWRLLLVSKIITNDNNGTTTEVDYGYNGGKLYLIGSSLDHKFSGFNTITETHPDYKVTTYFNQGDAASTTSGEQTDSYGQIGDAYRQDTYDLNSNVLKRTFYKWNTFDEGNGRSLVTLADQLTQDFDSLGSGHRDHAVEYTYATTTGDLTQTIDRGEVSGSSDGTYSDIGTDTLTKNITYASNASTSVDVPDDITLLNASSTQISETRYSYDNLGFGSTTLGNLTKQENWIASSTYASTTKSYNAYGLVASTTDGLGNKTTYAYDSFNFYPATVTNALSQNTSYQYDYATGKVATTTDPNNLTKVSVYDPIGRVVAEKQPDIASPSTLDIKKSVAYNDGVFPSYTATTLQYASGTSSTAYEYFDGLGRSIQTRQPTPYNNTYKVTDKLFNSAGLVYRETLPYFASSTSWAAATTTDKLLIKHAYDAMERPVSNITAVSTSTVSYAPWHTTSTDANGNPKDLWYDAYGNLANVVEHNAGTSATTTYTYDLNKNLSKLTDASGNVRNFTYDGLNRKLTAEDLHQPADTSFATSTYTYDLASNVTQKVDSKKQTVNYSYDTLNRQLTEDYSGQSGTEVTYVYDSCTYGIGSICIASSTDAKTVYAYNPLTLVTYATTTVSGANYPIGYSYDYQGDVTDISYPDGSRVHYGLDTTGKIQTLSTKLPTASSYSPIVTGTQYNPIDAASERDYNNGVQNLYTYDPTMAYRLTQIGAATTTQVGAGSSNIDSATLIKASSQYFSHADAAVFDVSSTLTAEAWVKLNSTPGAPDVYSIMEKWHSGNDADSSYFFVLEQNSIAFGIATPGNHTGASVAYTLSTGAWHHYAVTRSGTSVTFYVDGTQVGTTQTLNTTNSINSSTVDFSVGNGDANGGALPGTDFLDGKIDDVRLYNTARSGSAIASDYQQELTGSESNLVAYYALDATSTDSTSNHNTLINHNTATFTNDVPFTSGTSTITVPTTLQSISYTYDPMGNITQISDISTTSAAKVTTFTYDGLNRLATASTTSATSTPYKGNYVYDALGNMTNKYEGVGGILSSANPNSATTLKSSSQYFSHADAAVLHNLGSTTMEAWVKLNSTPGPSDVYAIFEKWHNGNDADSSYYFVLEQNTIAFGIAGGGTHTGASVVYTLATGVWHHYAVSRNGTSVSFYVDGSQVGTTQTIGTAANVNASTVDFTVSNGDANGEPLPGTDFLDGQIDDARIYNIARSSSSIASDYQQELTGSESGLVAYYTLDATTTDLTANHLTLTNVNSSTFTTDVPFGVGTGGSGTAYIYANTGYANPDAPTTIGSSTLTYDQSGNLTAMGSTTYTWDYRNRQTKTVGSNATTTYTFDANDQRMSQVQVTKVGSTTATTTSIYPSKFYSITTQTIGATTTATSTNYLYVGDTLVATIDQYFINGTATGTPQTYYVLPDYLGSTNLMTNASGTIIQTLDYYPFGAPRISQGASTNKRDYIGQFADNTGLNYLNARFYDAGRGQFISEDPVTNALGNPTQVQQLSGQDQQNLLSDPQQLNSYSYGRDNPIVNRDPSGRAFGVDDLAGFLVGAAIGGILYFPMSIATKQPLTLGGFVGASLSGGIIGWGAVNTPETLGVSNAVSASITTGLIGGYYGNLAKQAIDIKTGKQSGQIDPVELGTTALITAGTNGVTQAFIQDAKIPGLSSGRNSPSAVLNSIKSKTNNGTISSVSGNTALKAAVGSQASDAYRNGVGNIINLLITGYSSGNSSNNTQKKK